MSKRWTAPVWIGLLWLGLPALASAQVVPAPQQVDEDVLHLNWRTINVPAQAMMDAGYEVVNAAWDPL